MNAETLARALGGRRAGRQWMAPCPSHDDSQPSLSIRDGDNGKVLVRCHAGCDQALVIVELRVRCLWDDAHVCPRPPVAKRTQRHFTAFAAKDESERTTAAVRLWRSAVPAAGTPAEIYLHSRGIGIAVPLSVRFHPRLKHPTGGTWPGMVSLVTRGTDGQPLAIHRTFLANDGAGKAPVTPQKMMLGPCRSGAVQFATATEKLMVGEGIETCLAVLQATGLPAWAALSTSGLRTLELPAEIREVIVLADGDDPGEAAALDAARRWKREGRTVRTAHPPTGMDFNDVLLGRHASAPEASV